METRKYRAPILSILFFLLNYLAMAQLHIAKDNLNCTYGLKDTSNKWVVEPIYVSIYGGGSGFVVNDGVYEGFLSSTGQELIPVKQNEITCLSHDIEVVKNGKKGLFSNEGKQLTNFEFDEIAQFYYHNSSRYFCYKGFKDSIFTSLVDDKGRFLFKDVKGFIDRWPSNGYAMIYSTAEDQHYLKNDFGGLRGVIDTNGVVIVPKLYDEIEIYDAFFKVKKNGEITFLNNKNEIIHGPYSLLIPEYGYFGSSNVSKNLFIIAKKDSGFALIDNSFNTVIPFDTYDKIAITNIHHLDYSKNIFQVYKKNKTGIIDGIGNIIVPIINDDIKIIYNPKDHYKEESLYYIFKKKGKYGALDKDGKKLLTANFDLFEVKQNTETIFSSCTLVNTKVVYRFLEYEKQPIKLKHLFNNEFGSFYKSKNSIFRIPNKSVKKNGINYYGEKIGTFGDLVYFSRILNKTNSSEFYLFDLKGNELFKNKLLNVSKFTHNSVIIQTKNNHFGVINSKTFDFLMDTIYSGAYPNILMRNIWLKSDSLNGWILVDTLGKQIVKTVLDEAPEQIVNAISHIYYNFYDETSEYYKSKISILWNFYLNPNKMIATDPSFVFIIKDQYELAKKKYTVNSHGKTGLIDNTFNWLITPEYENLEEISEDYYLALTKGNRFGIVNLQNELVIDTVFTDFSVAFSNFNEYLNGYQDFVYNWIPEKKEIWWLLEKGEKRVLFNNKGKSISAQSAIAPNSLLIDSLVKEFAYKWEYATLGQSGRYYTFKADGSQNISPTCFRIHLTKEEKEKIRKQPYETEFYSIMKESYKQNIQKYPQHIRGYAGFTTRNIIFSDTTISKQPLKFGENYLSLQNNIDIFEVVNSHIDYCCATFDNYIVQNGKLNKINLTDIFKLSSILEQELMLAISKRDDLEYGCSTPELLVQQIGNKFYLSTDGLYLISKHDSNYKSRIRSKDDILIPKERLLLHAETKWIVDYLK